MRHRHKQVLEFWDRSKELSAKNYAYRDFAKNLFSLLLKSDIHKNDATTNSIIKSNKNISAAIVAKEDGILAGADEFKLLNQDLKINALKNDGSKIKNNEVIMEISGGVKKILQRERVSLNLLQRMSGIATLTNMLSKKMLSKKPANVKIAATRKTLWGLLDKKAVSIGGGLTHRLNLSDGIIIKDNHLKIFNHDFEKVLNITKNISKYIEIEVEDKNQALSAAKTIKKLIEKGNKSLYAVMLDKIPPRQIKSIIKDLKSLNLYDYVLLEASGNINPEKVQEYAYCGVDIISMGCITNSARILNMSLEIK